MHSLTHDHRKPHTASAHKTEGHVIDWGWRYDLMLWFFNTFTAPGKWRALAIHVLSDEAERDHDLAHVTYHFVYPHYSWTKFFRFFHCSVYCIE